MGVLSLGDAPKVNLPYIWADYLELLCLDSLDNISSIDAAAKEVKSQPDDAIDTELFDGSHQSYNHSPEFDDKAQSYAEEGLKLASSRVKNFGDHYPFEVDISEQEISLKESLSFENRLYISLLLCSNHKQCRLKKDVFTLGFEKISKFAFKGVLPPEGVVLHLGTQQSEENDVVQLESYKIYDKIVAVAKTIGHKCIADKNEFSHYNTGDGGIDLIGYISMPEPEIGQEIVILAQSATTKSKDEIQKKQNDASYHKWKRWINFLGTSLNILFISASIRQPDGRFVKDFYRQADAILIDRNRVITFISNWRNRSQENYSEQIIPNEIDQFITKLVS